MPSVPALMSADAPIFTVTVAARLAGMHPQTLRQYDRLGLVVPQRARGRGRRYTINNVRRLRLIQQLSQEEGVNLQGIRRILVLEDELSVLRCHVGELNKQIADMQWGDPRRGPRVFTADEFGRVDRGVYIRRPKALPPGS